MNSITVPGQLAIKSAYGRYGQYNVGRLTTPLGDFIVKDAQLDLYDQGKYDGDFEITRIHLWISNFGSRVLTEIRAIISKMTLSSIDSLTQDDAQRLTSHEVDPVEEQLSSQPGLPDKAPSLPLPTPSSTPEIDPLKDPTPFCVPVARQQEPEQAHEDPVDAADKALFGPLYPLGTAVRLDSTIDRRVLRQQRDRLHQLGYRNDPLTQTFNFQGLVPAGEPLTLAA